jgi:uncharacterized OsmC-like protein
MSANARVTLTQLENYRFDNHFDGGHTLVTDEPAPLGSDTGPSPSQLLVGAVANCLSASLLFAARKYRINLEPLRCEASAEVGRNDRNRMRVLSISVTLHCGSQAAGQPQLSRLLDSFEDFCTVTQSVAAAIPVSLTVLDADGSVLKAPA